jgi:hypothetical protein
MCYRLIMLSAVAEHGSLPPATQLSWRIGESEYDRRCDRRFETLVKALL